mmetsp:Transcript_31462/g.73492  ORF Transcript_31462/g.73492 Transcript_31462/m.73492 type:complete len:205 (+) Transcript_31462:581-1195(+)
MPSHGATSRPNCGGGAAAEDIRCTPACPSAASGNPIMNLSGESVHARGRRSGMSVQARGLAPHVGVAFCAPPMSSRDEGVAWPPREYASECAAAEGVPDSPRFASETVQDRPRKRGRTTATFPSPPADMGVAAPPGVCAPVGVAGCTWKLTRLGAIGGVGGVRLPLKSPNRRGSGATGVVGVRPPSKSAAVKPRRIPGCRLAVN